MALERVNSINDTSGHDVCDELLISVGDSIVNEEYETDTVARLGCDEFICILRDLANPASAVKTA
jgi:diguanylate cyclase (GGDEF)-like protein